MKNLNKTTVFLAFTFGISFSLAGIFYLLGLEYQKTAGIILATTYMFIPALSAFIVERIIHKGKIVPELFISFKINKWFIIAWLVTPIISFAAFGISLLFPDVIYSPEMEGMFNRFEPVLTPEQMEEIHASVERMPFHLIWITLLQGLLAGITINAIAGFGEELGWRGFLVRQFRNIRFMKASLIIGMIWGIWHAPIILMGHNYPQHPEFGVVMMTIWCILLSPLFLYITIKARSVIAAAIMHGTLNGTAGLSIIMIEGGNDLTVGATGLAGFISLILITVVFFLYDSKISREKIMTSVITGINS
jgi:uncharacterized protein